MGPRSNKPDRQRALAKGRTAEGHVLVQLTEDALRSPPTTGCQAGSRDSTCSPLLVEASPKLFASSGKRNGWAWAEQQACAADVAAAASAADAAADAVASAVAALSADAASARPTAVDSPRETLTPMTTASLYASTLATSAGPSRQPRAHARHVLARVEELARSLTSGFTHCPQPRI